MGPLRRTLLAGRDSALLALTVTSLVSAAEVPPPPIEYPDVRTATRTIELRDGRRIEVDRGASWHGTTVYLGLAGDLVALDDATGSVRWWHPVSPAWRVLAFTSDQVKGGPSKAPTVTDRALVVVRGAGDTSGAGEAEYYDLEHGQQCPGPSTVSGQVIKPRILAGSAWGACATPFILVATTAEQYARVTERLGGVDDAERDLQPLPVPGEGLARAEPARAEIDFTREVVLAVCYGDTGNMSGIDCNEVRSDEKRTLVRLSTPGFQTSGRSIPARPWILVALPKRDAGPYAIAWDRHQNIGDAPLWHEQQRIPPERDDALERLPPRAALTPTPTLPDGFVRAVHHSSVVFSDEIPAPGKVSSPFGTRHFEGDPYPKHWWGDAPEYGEWEANITLDWYELPDGVGVPHGDYRLERFGQVWQGRFVDGARDGEWRLANAWMPKDREAFGTFRQGQLNGPARIVISSTGAVVCSGSFADGLADGVWRWFDDHGGVEQEQVYDHGLWNGACTRRGIRVKEAFTCIHGQLDGDYRRWYSDGTLAASGGWVAASSPSPRNWPNQGIGLASTGTPGLRHGDWVSYAPDGHERWRGHFDHGTGTLVEFAEHGERWFAATFTEGRLTSLDEFRPDGSVKFHEQALGDGDTVIDHLDTDGTLLFTGVWRHGAPWSGTCADWEGRFLSYADGKALPGPPGMIREAAEARERQRALAALRKRRGMDEWMAPASATDEDRAADRVITVALARGDDAKPVDPAPAIAAARKLGAAAAMELGSRIDDPDPSVRSACAAALEVIPGVPGKPAEGITLAAVQVGPRSQPGDAVTLLVTITNTTDHDLCLFQHLWDLYLLKPGDHHFPHWLNFDAVPDLSPADFLRLARGASYRFIMDAEPNKDACGLGTAQVALTFPDPDNAGDVAPVARVTGHEWLISGPIRITYADEAADPRGLDLVEALAKEETRLTSAAALIALGPAALPALRRGLHSGDEAVRAACAAFICGAVGYHAADAKLDEKLCRELRPDLIAWWRRWGHRRRDETWHRLMDFAAGMPAAERADFQARLLEVIPWDNRSRIP